MVKPKPKRKRRIWRTLLLTLAGLVVFVLLFVAAFIFNPLEGSLAELRDIVPRGVNFFARKELLADDFDPFPVPKFWAELADARGFGDVQAGGIGQSWKRNGLDRSLTQLGETVDRVRAESGGWLDVVRDVIGREVIVAGYEQDYTQTPPRPLAEPWWCCYARVTWRVKALHGLAKFGFVQSKMREQGIEVSEQGDLLVIKPAGAPGPIYLKRHLDVLMAANNSLLLEQTQRLIDGGRDEEPVGQMAAYTEGAQKRIQRWGETNYIDVPNVVEFVIEPNAFDGFRRFAGSWPNPQNRDSMNERVLASFLNLKGWMQVAGGVMFTDGVLAATGQVGLNSKQHTAFQSSFYRAEKQRREEWLDPFFSMVPQSACAVAALRMPAGEFMHAMFDALEDADRELINEPMRRATFQGKTLNDTRDLIDQLKPAFLPRTGFVFHKNKPDLTRNEKGELHVPVSAQSPMPQVAWVFWLRPGMENLLKEVVLMLRTHYSTFGFRNVYHLPVKFGDITLPEPVTEFTNPKIPATGEVAMIVFRDFFVLSNSGMLIREILLTRYSNLTQARSVRDLPEFEAVERELPAEVNGLIWLHGANTVGVLDDYIAFAENTSELPDPEWSMQSRPAAEEAVRRAKFPQYSSKASMQKDMTEPGGEFDRAVVQHLQELWQRERTNFSADDRQQMQALRGMAQMLKAGSVTLELENNHIRFQTRLMMDFR